MAKPLVIVESPAKARTLERFLGNRYSVMASVGHIRDLPESAKEIPASIKDGSVVRAASEDAPLFAIERATAGMGDQRRKGAKLNCPAQK